MDIEKNKKKYKEKTLFPKIYIFRKKKKEEKQTRLNCTKSECKNCKKLTILGKTRLFTLTLYD